jgi:KipI family sensor histidine kinase inhibitor
MNMKWVSYGPNALLVYFADRVGDEAFARGRAITAALERHPPFGLVEFVPAFTCVLLEFDPQQVPDAGKLGPEILRRLQSAALDQLELPPIHEIPIVYDGPDLERVARLHQLMTAEVRELHAAPVYKVYMLGFAPGFPYLGELDPRLHTPRLATPRARVPAGAVGIGGEHTGIYSVESPGGWNLIGHTSVKLFDPSHEGEAMFLLRHGDRVKFLARG